MTDTVEPVKVHKETVVLAFEKVKEVTTQSLEVEFPFYTGYEDWDVYPNSYSINEYSKISYVDGRYEKITVKLWRREEKITKASLMVEHFPKCPITAVDVDRREKDNIVKDDFDSTRSEVLVYLKANDYL